MAQVNIEPMPNYPSNSKKSQGEKTPQEAPRPQKVIQSKASVKKTSKTKTFFHKLIGEDIPDVGNYIFGAVLIPVIRAAIVSFTTSIFGGNGVVPPNARPTYGAIRPDYTKYYNRPVNTLPGYGAVQPMTRQPYSFDDVLLSTREDAQVVLSQMSDILRDYGFVRVSDLYDLVGMSADRPFTDCDWGWTDISTAQIRPVADGYLLMMPRTVTRR